MLFIGTSEHTLDAKQRLAIPAKYRNQWNNSQDGTAWVAIPWPGGVIRLYTETSFEKLASGNGQTDSLTPGRGQSDFEAGFFGFAERLEMDSAGRIGLPRKHLELTRLKNDLVIVGARNRLEVRDLETWQAEEAGRFALLGTLADQLDRERRANPGA
ncbi:MAG: division/cell wall cluster transcriptional repressor MraZ [Phycisphaerales bacterium]